MKKVSFVALALIAMLSVASCKSDKCKCTVTAGKITVSDQVYNRPDNKKCSELTTSDIDIAGLKVDASGVVTLDCKNHHE